MAYGFSVRGNRGNLLISDEAPILTQAWTGKLIVNVLPGATGKRGGYGYCDVTYAEAVTSTVPPMVFAVPTAAASSGNTALGMFCHKGVPGGWTGFTVAILRDVFLQDGTNVPVGFDSGWQYRVCGFGVAGENGYDEYGLRIFDKLGSIIFDSAWPVIRFQGLLNSWQLGSFTRGYNTENYWQPNAQYDENGVDYDRVLAKGTHVWGVPNNTHGLLLSSINSVNSELDMGDSNREVSALMFVGFIGAARDVLQAVAVLGKAQHPNGDVSVLNRRNILTADFTGI